jgi:hypothetical protein
VLLALATTHVQQRDVEQACAVGEQALAIPSELRIGPIDQRAHDLMRELGALALHPCRGCAPRPVDHAVDAEGSACS